MDDNVNPFPWIKENIVSSSAGGSSLHRQGVCVVSQAGRMCRITGDYCQNLPMRERTLRQVRIIRSQKIPVFFRASAVPLHVQAGAFF